MTNIPSIDAILFDLDGTLVNSLHDIASAMNKILADDSLPTHDLAAYALFIGGGARHLVDAALPPARRGEIDTYLGRFRRHYRDNLVIRTAPYPGVIPLLRALTARDVPMAILSNKPDEMTQVLVHHFFGDVRWRGVVGAREGEPKKPDPKAVAPLLSYLGAPGERVMMVGDTKTDMQTATATQMVPVGVTWGFRARAELEEHGAAFVIDTPDAILELLGG